MSVTTPAGFVAGAASGGVKAGGATDLAVVATSSGAPVAAAAVFTTNAMTAAPVLVTRDHLGATGGRAAAVVLNSGNANAATGHAGVADAEAMCAGVAAHLGCAPAEVLVCSTGIIGVPLPMASITAALPELVAARHPGGAHDAADAILTTDTVRKEVVIEADGFTVGGMAKGAAMLAPHLATMLAVITTDAGAEPEVLRDILEVAVDGSFNTLSTDGCTSTNDTVILLASGAAGPVDPRELSLAVSEACRNLAHQMAEDAEGATKVVTVTVAGAYDDVEADRAARAVANSMLCKCSWYGEDPYWGRVASELGAAGVRFEASRCRISYGGVVVADGATSVPHDTHAVAAHVAGRRLELLCELGMGPGRASIVTNDLTHAYVDENMGTS